MEFAKKKRGAVFFVDILGFGTLTQKKIKLDESDFLPWLQQYKSNDPSVEYTNQFLAASLLSSFRTILLDMDREFMEVNVAQLSDCAFIWSEKVADVVLFANNFMTRAINEGLLCRGGLSYGEIIETDQNENHQLGKFIVGEAVTNAVKLEGLSKGCRILIDDNFPQSVYQCDKGFSNQIMQMFQPFTNPLDYSVYDEFKWYLIPNIPNDINTISMKVLDRVELTQERLKLAVNLRYGSKFSWNAASKEGFVQVKASIDFLTEYDAVFLKIWHDFRWGSEYMIEDKKSRTEHMCNRVKKTVESIEHYKEYVQDIKTHKIVTKFLDIKKS